MLRKPIMVLLASIFLSGCTFSLASLRPNQKSGLQVTSTPQATAFLDGNSLGITPILEENLKPGTYTIKLTPSDNSIQSWETQVTLAPGILTVVDRKLSPNLEQSHGYTLSFEKLSDSKSSQLAVTTIPDSVTVTIDGSPQGFTPVSLDALTEGDHTILLTSPGFEDKTIRARTVKGHSLTIAAQLSKKFAPPVLGLEDLDATPSAEPEDSLSPTPTSTASIPTPAPTKQPTTSTVAKPYVEIDSSLGWVNVRTSPGGGTIIITANNGDRFSYLGETSPNNYFKIQYSDSQIGWVSSDYSKLVN